MHISIVCCKRASSVLAYADSNLSRRVYIYIYIYIYMRVCVYFLLHSRVHSPNHATDCNARWIKRRVLGQEDVPFWGVRIIAFYCVVVWSHETAKNTTNKKSGSLFKHQQFIFSLRRHLAEFFVVCDRLTLKLFIFNW